MTTLPPFCHPAAFHDHHHDCARNLQSDGKLLIVRRSARTTTAASAGTSSFRLSRRRGSPAMTAAKRATIVSIAPSGGLHGGPQASIYSPAKAAIIVFIESLARKVGPHGIQGHLNRTPQRRGALEKARAGSQSAWPRGDRR
jgi:hypothetical protein